MRHPRSYRNQEVVILGLAKSGQAVAKVFHEYGAKVTVNDMKQKADCPEAEELERLGIEVICGSHPETLLHPGVSVLVKNPGIKYTIAPIRQAQRLGIEIVTEVEVAYHLSEVPIIGITGSNGKTTTTTWIGSMLEEAGLFPVVAGNIGTPLCDAVRNSDTAKWMVVELSSFQLKGTVNFHPQIACLLNVYETHMDYHGSMDDYIESKLKMLDRQTASDIAVLNWDDPVCRSAAGRTQARIVPFSYSQELTNGVYLEHGADAGSSVIVYRDENGHKRVVLAVDEIGIPGNHNVENALAATAVALSAGAPVSVVAACLKAFRGVEHRLEFVRDVEGIAVYNDSKATNPAAAAKSIESFTQPIVWVAGGQDRGTSFDSMLPVLKERVKGVVALGETKADIVATARRAGIEKAFSVDTANNADAVEQAVRKAAELAESGDVILFSPACASWDMFVSYEQRGRMFKASVHNL